MEITKKIVGVVGTVLLMALVINACDNFLESPAQGTLSSDVLANEDGVEGNLISAYAMLDGYAGYGGWGAGASNWIYGSVASDNAYKGSAPDDQGPVSDVEFYQWNTSGTDTYLNDKWTVLYDGISRANATIELLNSIDDVSDADRQRIEGEAKFLRAHYHFEAWKLWKNIPYYTEEDEDFRKPNTGTNPIQNILADLDSAISLLPPSQSDVGRVTEWTAKAYKGRVEAYTGDWGAALETLREVEEGGPYALEENFQQVFSAFNDNGTETILAYQASSGDGDPTGANGNWNDRLNFPHGGSPFGCCGFHQPSQNLVNAFKVDASGQPLPLSSPDSWNDDDENFDASRTEPVDPRLDWTVGRDGVPFLDWGKHEAGWIRDRGWAGPYSAKKTVYEQGSDAGSPVGWSSFQLHHQNMHLYRYADMLLLLAEAEVEAGDPNAAIAIVNRIRERAGQAAQGPGTSADDIEVPIDDPSIEWANYEVGLYSESGWTQADAREVVHMERRLELALEGHRYFDLRRWGVAQQVLNDYLSVEENRREYLTGANNYEERNNLYPIPSVQRELSEIEGESTLEQNDGW